MNLLILLAVGAGPTRQYIDILVYADAQYVGSPSDLMVVKALNYLTGMTNLIWTLYFKDPVGFGNTLAWGGWNLVIVDHASMPGIGAYWDDLEAFVQSGGTLIVSTYDVDGSHTGYTSLWATMGAVPAGDIADLQALYIWEPAVFDSPEQPPNPVNFSNDYLDEGDSLSVLPGFMAAAGWGYQYFQDYPNAAVVTQICELHPPTLLNSFIVQEADRDDDSDGIPDGAEIYIDEIWYIIECRSLGAWEQEPRPGLIVKAFPNPFSGLLRVNAPPGAEVSLWDAEGRKVCSGVSGGEMTMETGNLPPGAYILMVISDRQTAKRVLLKK